MTKAPLPRPPLGSLWRHKDDGAHYTVYDVSNLLGGRKRYPVRITYLDQHAQTFTRELRGWTDSYELVELGHLEEIELRAAASAVQGAKDLLAKRMSEVIAGVYGVSR